MPLKERTESQKALRTLMAAMMAGLLSVPVYALHLGGKGNFLAGALRQADQAAIGALASEVRKVTERAETTERKIDELKKQRELDAAASRPIRVQIFNQAWQVRGDNWRDAASKPKMERTIPLFRALVRNDVENRYHMNHGHHPGRFGHPEMDVAERPRGNGSPPRLRTGPRLVRPQSPPRCYL